MTDPSDAQLVERCLDGQREAFATLVERYQEPVFNVAYRMTNNREDAADLAQDAFVRAYRKLAQYRPEYAFKNWVITICVNLTKNRFRSVVRRRNAEEAHLELYARHRQTMKGEVAIALGEALCRLNEKIRLPLVLKHAEGYSYEDIAEMLGLGVSAVKMRVKRGRDELVRVIRRPQDEVGYEPN